MDEQQPPNRRARTLPFPGVEQKPEGREAGTFRARKKRREGLLFVAQTAAIGRGVREHAEAEQATEGVRERFGGLARVTVEVDHAARQPVSGLLGVLDDRWWLPVQARRLQERSGDVVDDR
jgi:hypothetical protein